MEIFDDVLLSMVHAGKKKDGFKLEKRKKIGPTSEDWKMNIHLYVLS